MQLYLLSATVVCLFFLYITFRNSLTLKKWSYMNKNSYPGKHFRDFTGFDTSNKPLISVIIPARNEEQNIARCLTSLLNQDYENYEILVLDDNSGDRTWEILKTFAGKSDKIRIFSGLPLPEDWSGKQYACHQLVKKAKGEYYLFIDADTVHSPFSLSWALCNLMKHKVDFLSAYIYHLIGSFGEAVVVPAVYLMTTLILPLWKVPEKNNSWFSFAIGQFIFCKADAFHAIGEYSLFKNSVVEDIDIARIMKAHDFRTIFLDAKEYVQCRMYTSFIAAYKGLIKNLYGALNQNLLLLAGLFILVALGIEFPVLHFINIVLNGGSDLAMAVLPVSVFFCTWSLVVKDRKLPPFIAFLYPLLFINIMIISILSFIKTGPGGKGAEWKGRLVKCHSIITEEINENDT